MLNSFKGKVPAYIQEMITPSKSKIYSIRSNEECALKVPKFKHDTFGKHALGLWHGSTCQRKLGRVTKLKHSSETLRLIFLLNLWMSLLLQFDFAELLKNILECYPHSLWHYVFGVWGASILSPLIADLSGLWGSSMQVMHGRPQGLFSRWQGG